MSIKVWHAGKLSTLRPESQGGANYPSSVAASVQSVSCSVQFEALQLYLEGGGAALVMMTEGGEAKHNTNINFLLEEFGIMANSGEGGRR